MACRKRTALQDGGSAGCWLRQNRRNRFARCTIFLTVGAAAPLQQAGASALHFPQGYYDKLAATYAAKRERLLKILTSAGFTVFKPRGAYYIMTDIARFADPDPVRFQAGTKDVRFAKFLVEKNWRGRRPWLQLLQRRPRRCLAGPLHVLQKRRDPRCGRRTLGQAPRLVGLF